MNSPRGEEDSSTEGRLRPKRERPHSLHSDDDSQPVTIIQSLATAYRRSAARDSTLIQMLRRSACHVDPEDSMLLSCAASRIEDLQSENRKLKQRFKSMDRDMRAILDQFDIS